MNFICKLFGHKWKIAFEYSRGRREKNPAAHCQRCLACIINTLPKLKDAEFNYDFNKRFKRYKDRLN